MPLARWVLENPECCRVMVFSRGSDGRRATRTLRCEGSGWSDLAAAAKEELARHDPASLAAVLADALGSRDQPTWGRRTVTVVPWPSTDFTSTVPSCHSTTLCTSERPRPVPWISPAIASDDRKNRENRRSCSSAG